jgi:hypothetical protein
MFLIWAGFAGLAALASVFTSPPPLTTALSGPSPGALAALVEWVSTVTLPIAIVVTLVSVWMAIRRWQAGLESDGWVRRSVWLGGFTLSSDVLTTVGLDLLDTILPTTAASGAALVSSVVGLGVAFALALAPFALAVQVAGKWWPPAVRARVQSTIVWGCLVAALLVVGNWVW